MKLEKPKFLKDHRSHGYTEPIFVFLKAIGISEIIKLPESFSFFWKDNFLVSSLWGHSIFRVRFDNDFNKILFYEKIYLGKRIRDIIFLDKYNLVLLALEENGEIAIIEN